MKCLPCLFLLGNVSAQEAEAGKPAKVPPPRAQVIEEDEPPAPAVTKKAEDQKKNAQKEGQPAINPNQSDGKATEAAKQPGTTKRPSGEVGQPQTGEMPPLSELTPLTSLTPKVEKPVNEGIQIHVEKLNRRSGSGSKQGKVTITSPWPAKPLDAPPMGWRFIPAPAGIDPYRTTVKLGDHDSVNLAITPYVLVPVSDGRNVIRIAEPGYQPELGYDQEITIGALLIRSTEDIEEHEKLTGQAIQRLQQLLSSLPK